MRQLRILTFIFVAVLAIIACQSNSNHNSSADNQVQKEAGIDSSAYIEKGMMAIGATFGALSQKLMQEMQEHGAVEAVQYCNTAALPLTDSLAKLHQIGIKRTSLKWRNPKNAPKDWEKAVLTSYEAQIKKGEQPKPQLQQLANKQWVLSAPIQIQGPCLKCHGKNIDQALADQLDQLYPKDQARGYEEGDLRGIWSITFENN